MLQVKHLERARGGRAPDLPIGYVAAPAVCGCLVGAYSLSGSILADVRNSKATPAKVAMQEAATSGHIVSHGSRAGDRRMDWVMPLGGWEGPCSTFIAITDHCWEDPVPAGLGEC